MQDPPHAITMSSLTHAVNQCSINSRQPCGHAVVNQCLLNAVVVMLSAHAQTLYDCLCDACWWSVDAVVIFLQTTLIPRPPSATVSSPRSHRAEIWRYTDERVMLASTAISLTVGGIPWYSQVNDLTAFSTLMRLFVIVLGISSPVLKNLGYCPSLIHN